MVEMLPLAESCQDLALAPSGLVLVTGQALAFLEGAIIAVNSTYSRETILPQRRN